MTYQDKLGVYRVGDLKFYSKLEAIEMHTKTGIHPHWDFNEAVFSSYDWTVEPKEDLLELYKQRAEQLRNQYDYIILMYSGGSDSQTVLESFTDNNIHLDEVCSWVNYKGSSNKKSYLNEEIYETAIPKMEQLKEKYPHITYRILDLTDITLCSMANNGGDWIYSTNHFFGPNVISRANLGTKVKEWQKIILSGKKLCIVWGKDKPRVHHIDGKFALQFIDLIDDGASVLSSSGKQSYTDEFFFWTPDFSKILIKQAHIIKNYLSMPNFQNLPHVSTLNSGLSYRVSQGKTYWLSVNGSNWLVYPQWKNNSVVAGKPPSIVIASRDCWFYKISNHQAKSNLKIGLDKLQQCVPDHWKNNTNDFSAGIKACWSKPYFLEK
jgi:hypothetical protein